MLTDIKISPLIQPGTSNATKAPLVDGIANSIAEIHYVRDANGVMKTYLNLILLVKMMLGRFGCYFAFE